MSLGKRIIILFLSLFLLPSCGGGGGGTSPEGGSTVPADTTATIRLTFDASSDSSVVGYWVYYGTRSGIYQNRADTGPQSSSPVNYTLTGLAKGQTYYIAVSAYDPHKNESGFSNEVSGVAR